MKHHAKLYPLYLIAILGGIIFFLNPLTPLEAAQKNKLPEGVYLDLTRDFYETLKNEGGKNVKSYSNDPSTEYLRKISISAQFMVETNLQILKQQEQILQLLRSGLEKKRK
jgi:hypothetical protein